MDPSSVDPKTVLGAGLIAWASKDMLARVLGPTADYLGKEVEGLVEKGHANLGRIFSHAVKKLGSKIKQPGAVNPRVLKQVWSEGAFVEDELAAEYFGGLLASARTPDGKDDRVLSLLSTVRDLSVYDLRLHHLAYLRVRASGLGSHINMRDLFLPMRASAQIPYHTYVAAMGIKIDDTGVQEFADQSLFALAKHDLIGSHTASMMYQVPPAEFNRLPEPGITIVPSHYGAKLFLWAHGYADKRIDQIFDPSLDLGSPTDTAGMVGSPPPPDD